jgi:diketogulonate reductase-like aldo/keto reductase
MSQFALRWILMFDAVTCAIPGVKRAEQVADNSHASELPPLTDEDMAAVRRVYEQNFFRSLETDGEGQRLAFGTCCGSHLHGVFKRFS